MTAWSGAAGGVMLAGDSVRRIRRGFEASRWTRPGDDDGADRTVGGGLRGGAAGDCGLIVLDIADALVEDSLIAGRWEELLCGAKDGDCAVRLLGLHKHVGGVEAVDQFFGLKRDRPNVCGVGLGEVFAARGVELGERIVGRGKVGVELDAALEAGFNRIVVVAVVVLHGEDGVVEEREGTPAY